MAVESLEEIFIGKIKNNGSPEVVYGKPGQYAIFHRIITTGLMNSIHGINFEHLKGYLRGSAYGKYKDNFSIYHGIPEDARMGVYPKVKYNPLSQEEMGKLLTINGLKDFFKSI